MRRLALVVALLAFVACKKSGNGGQGLEQVNESFRAAGLKVEPFVPTDGTRFSATRCLTGRVEGVEAILCEYQTPEMVRLGKKAGEEWIGSAVTGTALEHGRSLLALADRNRADPNGKAIHRITAAFLEKGK